MKKRTFFLYLTVTLVLIVIGWTVLTFYVETTGPSKQWTFESVDVESTAFVVFDPDPFYNLDEQICLSFAKGMAESAVNVQVTTVAAAEHLQSNNFDVVIYCANTYNWRPDWSITNYIDDNKASFTTKKSVAITLGAGSTEASKQHLEKVITNAGGQLIGSYSLWLWRPNDETKMEEPNIEVAIEMAHNWGKQIAKKLK